MTTTNELELESTEIIEPEKEEKAPRKVTLGLEKINKREIIFRGMRAFIEVPENDYQKVKEVITTNKDFKSMLSVSNEKNIIYIYM